jgi:transcriptional regulator with XRE-family HTH domain
MTCIPMSPISLRIQQLRESKGWSQSELARQSGVPQTTISRLEAGKIGVVNLAHLEKLADAFGVNAAVLIEHTPGGKGKRG